MFPAGEGGWGTVEGGVAEEEELEHRGGMVGGWAVGVREEEEIEAWWEGHTGNQDNINKLTAQPDTL